MTEFNFDIDQIANNTVAKVDKTTQIIETNTGSDKTLTFLEKLSPEQQEGIKAHVPQLDRPVCHQSKCSFGFWTICCRRCEQYGQSYLVRTKETTDSSSR